MVVNFTRFWIQFNPFWSFEIGRVEKILKFYIRTYMYMQQYMRMYVNFDVDVDEFWFFEFSFESLIFLT